MQQILDQSAKARQIPREISLQILDERHCLKQIRKLLSRAFVVNNEPIINVLGDIFYPSFPTSTRLPLMEKSFSALFPHETLQRKMEQGYSLVAVKDNDPQQVVSVMFTEEYKSKVYEEDEIHDGDAMCQLGLDLMQSVHKKAKPLLDEYAKTNSIFFVSHTATHPDYRSLGIVENLTDLLRAGLEQNTAVYCQVTANRWANHLMRRHGMHVMEEVFYDEYEYEGVKVFEGLSKKEVSAKALFILL